MKHRSAKSFLGGSILLVVLLVLAAALPISAQSDEKVIRVGMWSSPGNMSPINADSSYGYFIVPFVFDSLVTLEEDFSFSPRLAASWDVSEDGNTYTFHLQPDAVWHDGTPLTSADVLFTIETVADPDVQTNRGSTLRAIEGLDSNGKMVGDDIPGVSVIDDLTIAVTTKTPVDPARFLEQFGFSLYIIPKHLLEGLDAEELVRTPVLLSPEVGSGPFRFVRYETDQFIEMEKNPDYFLEPAKVDRVFVRIVGAASLAAQLIREEIDVTAGPGIGEIPLQDVEIVENAPNVRIVTEPALGYQFMGINNLQPYFGDARVRQALAYGTNRQLMVDQLYRGEAVLAKGPFSPVTPYENEDIDYIPYDPDHARALLEEAGWDFGQTVEILVPTGNRQREQSGSIIQANLQAIGMQVRLQQLDFPTVLSRVFADEYDLVLLGWTDTFDPDHLSSTFMTGGQYNLTNFSHPRVDELIEEAGAERDPDIRKELYDEIQVLMQEYVPAVFMYYPNMLAAANVRLVNADPSIVRFENRAVEWDILEAE